MGSGRQREIKTDAGKNRELKNREIKKYPEKDLHKPASRNREIEANARERIKKESALEKKLNTSVDRELYRREREGVEMWRNNPQVRKELSHEMGTDTHKWKLEQKRVEEALKKRHEGKDFGIEVEMKHPDGKSVQLDYVDYKTDVIVDIKPLKKGESNETLKKQYAEQRQRHIDAYEHTTGRQVLHYDYETYASPKDLADDV